jgi:hypothetical protein
MTIWGWMILVFFCILAALLCWDACAADGIADKKIKKILDREYERRRVRKILKYMKRIDESHYKAQHRRRCAMRLILFLAVLVLLAVPVLAQTTTGPTIDPTTVEAILVIVGGGIAALITQLLKGAFKLTGFGALLLAGVVGIGATAAYFLFIHPPFEFWSFVLYSLVIFGEATGFYHFYQKRTA